MDYQVIVFDPTTGVASMGTPTVPKILTGMAKLTQIVVLAFLKNPGQDVFYPDDGAGFRSDIGQLNITDGPEVKSIAIQRTKRIESDIISRQPTDSGDPSEKLKKLQILDVAYDDSTSALMLRVKIINEAGDSTDVLV